MSDDLLLRVRLSLKGRPIKTYTFAEETVTIGRDPDADIFLDNTGISRSHAKIERTSHGYVIEDLNSANGTFVNDKQITSELIRENDVIRVGKFSLWVTFSEDRRATGSELARRVSPDALQGTTVLSTDQLSAMLDTAKEEQPQETVQEPGANPVVSQREPSQARKTMVILATVLAFMIGSALGAGAMTWLLRH